MVTRISSLPLLVGLSMLAAPGCKNLELDAIEALACEGEQRACSGTACTCTGGTCALECPGDCGLNCSISLTDRCDVTAVGALDLSCGTGAECDAVGGDGSSLSCDDAADCQATLGARSTVYCRSERAVCDVRVGARSVLICESGAPCTVACDGPDCFVTCRGECDITCTETGQPPMACSGLVYACGASCPTL